MSQICDYGFYWHVELASKVENSYRSGTERLCNRLASSVGHGYIVLPLESNSISGIPGQIAATSQ